MATRDPGGTGRGDPQTDSSLFSMQYYKQNYLCGIVIVQTSRNW